MTLIEAPPEPLPKLNQVNRLQDRPHRFRLSQCVQRVTYRL